MRCVAIALLAACGSSNKTEPMVDAAPSGPPEVVFPRTGITSDQMAVLVNDDDPLSVSIAEYYTTARNIPAANIVHLHVAAGASLSVASFTPLKAQVDAALVGTSAEAIAITWTQPYAVDYMSITSAFALGYIPQDPTTNACSNTGPKCGPDNPYVADPASTAPFTDHAFRPAMTIPATTLDEAKALIDRGVASDNTWPMGSAYLMSTSDHVRSARCVLDATYGYVNECQLFLDTWDTVDSGIDASIVMADSISNKTDVLFYVQGLASVPNLTTNTYLPGAVADHLTSFGGDIPTSGQMSCFEFIKAGATGSYGTVVEPYAFQQKFPDPRVLIPRYFGGNTLIEAYWKSVSSPGMGIFIGEPLARPFGTGYRSMFGDDGSLTIETTAMIPGHTYTLEAGDSSDGPFTPVMANLTVAKYQISTFTIPNATAHTYRFRE
jgi:uncharacterized protein (TIGR03790 family)